MPILPTLSTETTSETRLSCTSTVSSFSIETNLPSYFVCHAVKNDKVRVDYGVFINGDIEDYEVELDDSEKYLLEREDSTASSTTFNLIDTPGLNDTSIFDESNIAIILEALETTLNLHLPDITIANNPSLTVSRTLSKRIAIDSKKVIRNCITQNTLRNLLSVAKLNQLIPVRTMRLTKTEKTIMVDQILKDKCEDKIEALIMRPDTMDKEAEETYILDRINSIQVNISAKADQLNRATKYLAIHDIETLELLHEDLYQQDFSYLNTTESSKPLYYPEKKRASEPGFIHHILDHVDMRTHNIKVYRKSAAKERRSGLLTSSGFYHVNIYITRRKKFTVEIEKTKREAIMREAQLEDYRADLEAFENQHQNTSGGGVLRSLLEEMKLSRYLLARVSSRELDVKIFKMLVAAKKDELEHLESYLNYVTLAPVNSYDVSNDAGEYIGNEGLNGRQQDFKWFKRVSDDAKDTLASATCSPESIASE
ncbi:hypothetical protein BGZ59_008578 [Podila verticillata]|nr:hypothetical protein BGZ59_008578 [Podila verticillata]